ncbi:MAG: hypothetical protein V1921_05185 [Candidatus Altiarchaeota archaeon]
MINWQYYPKSDDIPAAVKRVIDCFEKSRENIGSPKKHLQSNEVLGHIRDNLIDIGFKVEGPERIVVPVLFGMNGKLEKSFQADAYNEKDSIVLEVEAGRGVLNNQFLKDLFQACMMHDVKYLAVAVRNNYKGNKDFGTVIGFFDTLYASRRLTLPLNGILVIGY